MAKNFFDVNDKTLEPSEVHRKDSDELYETAFNEDQKKVLDNFTPGGGGGSVLEVGMTVSENSVILDKTWQEIRDAMPNVAFSGDVYGVSMKIVPSSASVGDGQYVILMSGNFPEFISNSADGYPSAEL